jgi:subtilisin family serine protease
MTNAPPDQHRYLILAKEPLLLSDVLTQIAHEIEVIDVLGPSMAPHTAVVAMNPGQAEMLARRFQNLKIEPDRPLSLFSDGKSRQVVTKGNKMAKNPESGPASPSDNIPAKANGVPSSGGTAEQQAAGGVSASSVGGPGGSAGSGGGMGNDMQGRSASGSAGNMRGRVLGERKGQYLIAARRTVNLQAMGMQPLSFSVIEQTLRSSPDIEVIDTVGPKNIMGALANGMGEVPSVLVARMSEQKAAMLLQQAQGRLIVERDSHLRLSDPAFQMPVMVGGIVPTTGPSFNVDLTVVGRDNAPIADAEVYVFGSLLPVRGVTDRSGRVRVSLFGESAQSIQSLYIKPKADYWSYYQRNPEINGDESNTVSLRALADWPGLAHFPKQQTLGWGQKAMRLDQLPNNYRGQGIKIAVIDSGVATTHDDLKGIRFGFDVINKKSNPNSWNEDSIAHGSHCAGVIAGADNDVGVRGFAPDAEIHICKLFPGGQVSQLIDALEYCIEKQIDVVNLSLGGAEPSEALEQQIQRAKRAGVACIVAAGNSSGPVQYPASSPNVLAVAAIGKLNEFPADSYHTQSVTTAIDANGYFAPRFSCFGPQIAVCGPGVAITSSVPSNNYAVWDGTSMAAPHITGLAALVLAHHPEFQTVMKARSAERVDRLFQIIKLSARPVNLGDPSRTGFGLPDVLVALGLQARQQAFLNAPYSVLASLGGNLGQAQSGLQQGGYSDQIQAPLQQQNWGGYPWAQIGQSQGINLFDPAYASFVQSFGLQPQINLGMQNFPFGLPASAFGRVGW